MAQMKLSVILGFDMCIYLALCLLNRTINQSIIQSIFISDSKIGPYKTIKINDIHTTYKTSNKLLFSGTFAKSPF